MDASAASPETAGPASAPSAEATRTTARTRRPRFASPLAAATGGPNGATRQEVRARIVMLRREPNRSEERTPAVFLPSAQASLEDRVRSRGKPPRFSD